MSGIVGIWNLDGRPVQPTVLTKMSISLTYCGPDGQGQWIQGPIGLACQLRRVTPEPIEEIQPIVYESGTVLIFDGRLDNREELLSMLRPSQPISSKSPDPAFILAAYEAWGDRFAEHLTGDFAFALFDARQHRLILVRDAIGLRPLYYFRTRDVFLLASQIKAILAHPQVRRRPNDDALAGFILAGRTLDRPDSTLFQNVFSLPPGHMALISDREFTIRQFWEFDTARRIRFRSFEECAEAFNHYFTQAVNRRLRSARPVAVSVSGGLDSSSILSRAAAFGRHGPNRHTNVIGFSSTYPKVTPADETFFLSDIEKNSGLEIERIPPVVAGLARDAEEQVWYSEGPFLSGLWSVGDALMRRVQQSGARILLSGTWGDQMLVEQAYLLDLLRRGSFIQIWKHLHEYPRWFTDVEPSYFRRNFLHGILRSLVPDSFVPWLRRFRKKQLLSASSGWYTEQFQARALSCALNGSLPKRSFASAHARALYMQCRLQYHVLNMEWCTKVGSMYELDMAFPFLDRELISFLMGIPGDMQTWDGVPKALLRKSVNGMLPEPIAERRSKSDFTHFVNESVSRDLSYVVERLRTDSMAVNLGYLHADKLRNTLSRLPRQIIGDADAAFGNRAITDLFALEVWLQVYFGDDSFKPRDPHQILETEAATRRITNDGQTEACSKPARDRVGTANSEEKAL